MHRPKAREGRVGGRKGSNEVVVVQVQLPEKAEVRDVHGGGVVVGCGGVWMRGCVGAGVEGSGCVWGVGVGVGGDRHTRRYRNSGGCTQLPPGWWECTK